ncbi:MAG: S8 family serine peptidase [Planctomycetota bacterium]
MPLLFAAASSETEAKVHPALRALWAEEPGAESTLYRAYAVLEERLTLDDLRGEGALRLSRSERRRHVAERLRVFAAERQGATLALLEELRAAGAVDRIDVLWVANAVVFRGTPAALRRVAELPEVQRIGWSPVRRADAAVEPPPGPPADGSGPTGTLEAVQAPDAWALGYQGAGTLLVNIDSGVERDHPALDDQIWSNPGEVVDGLDNDGNGYVDDTWGWDFLDDDNDPAPGDTPLVTLADHGTRTAGLMVGDGADGLGPITGVAPQATMAVARTGTEAGQWLALQYAIGIGADATGSSNCYRWDHTPLPDYEMHRHVQDMILAAGMLHANAAGNQGLLGGSNPIPFQVCAPSAVPSAWRHPVQTQLEGGVSGVVAVGGLSPLSSHGPVAWEDVLLYESTYPHAQDPALWDYPVGGFGGSGQGLVKPDVAAPFNATTTDLGGGFAPFSGTSASSPHVSGSFMLLFDARPEAEPRHLSQALQITALDFGAPGKDNDRGAGLIQVYDALLRLLTLVKVDDLSPALGDTLTVSTYGEPDNFYAVFFGALADSFAAGPSGGFDLLPPFGVLEVGQFDASGASHTPVVLPQLASLAGVDVHLQAASDDTLGATGLTLVSVLETFRIQQ